MAKQKLGNKPLLYPCPVVMVGAEVDGQPNFMTIAFCGLVNTEPGMVAVGALRTHRTNQGIRANRTFSVNVPSTGQLAVTDYVGIYSGHQIDKSELFEVFYGELGNAPMIADCALNIECRVREILDLGGRDEIIIGEIVEVYAEDRYLTKGLPDAEKMQPFVFTMGDNRYFGLGSYLGLAFSVGKDYKQQEE